MKKFCFTSVLMFVWILLFNACSNMDVPDIAQDKENDLSELASTERPHFIDQENAISIARRVLGHGSTRSLSVSTSEIEYVLSDGKTRSEKNLSDTLAYVINFEDNRGFVIVSSDNRVYPVLAFSDQGQFSFTNEIARDNFISNIEHYIQSADMDSNYKVNGSEFDGCVAPEPLVKISMGQRSPWNKYVVKEHPSCPVGCVAVATALVLSHTTEKLKYHGTTYPMKTLVETINKGQSTDYSSTSSYSSPRRVAVGNAPSLITYTYSQAVDSMAKVLYWIGKDVEMDYRITGSGANSEDAYNLCKSLDVKVSSGYEDYDLMEILEYLKKDHIVYLRGRSVNSLSGHAWVCDGYRYCVDIDDETKILDAYVHCDWGWYGEGNGYFSGSVFNVEDLGYSYRPENYFAVKRALSLSMTLSPQ